MSKFARVILVSTRGVFDIARTLFEQWRAGLSQLKPVPLSNPHLARKRAELREELFW